jgi:TonB-dependent Receptor Plug Domain
MFVAGCSTSVLTTGSFAQEGGNIDLPRVDVGQPKRSGGDGAGGRRPSKPKRTAPAPDAGTTSTVAAPSGPPAPPGGLKPGLNSDGSTVESGGLYVPGQSFGPFGTVSARDLPYSTNSVPQAIIRDQQAKSLEDIVRNDPSVTTAQTAVSVSNFGSQLFNIRGFTLDPSAMRVMARTPMAARRRLRDLSASIS